MTGVTKGDLVRVHYTTHSGDECVLETSALREPLEFHAGDSTVIAGLSSAVIGMQVGEKKRIRVPPEQAFGYRDLRWQQTAPRTAIPDRLADGDQLAATVYGDSVPVWIRGLQLDQVTLDANHPLAGETLIIDVELAAIARAAGDGESRP